MSTQILQLNHAKGRSSVANNSEVVPAAQGEDCASSPAGIEVVPDFMVPRRYNSKRSEITRGVLELRKMPKNQAIRFTYSNRAEADQMQVWALRCSYRYGMKVRTSRDNRFVYVAWKRS